MVAVSLPAALFVLTITGGAVGLIAWLLSGAGVVVTRSVRASARPGSGDDASGSDRPAPTRGAMPEPPGR
jgi:hypothetical protein